MPAIIANTLYDILPTPSFGGYKPTRRAPKITFEAEGGYKHQREKWPSGRKVFDMDWQIITAAEAATLDNFIEYTGSDSFLVVPPETMWPKADGTIAPELRLCRIIDEETSIKPLCYGYFTAKITCEEV